MSRFMAVFSYYQKKRKKGKEKQQFHLINHIVKGSRRDRVYLIVTIFEARRNCGVIFTNGNGATP